MAKKAINNKAKSAKPHAGDGRDDDDLDHDDRDDEDAQDGDDEDEAEEDERPPKKDSKKSSSKPTAKPAAKKRPTTATVEQRRLDQLIEHPLQAIYNDGLGGDKLKKLAANIEKNGLREMIQILPDNEAGLPANTPLDGHQRWKALSLNGETTTEVIVRYDLAHADALTVEKVFLEFNSNRQHRDLLLQARAALRLYELEKKAFRGKPTEGNDRDARDRVGKAIGMSGRNLNRYFRVLKTPIEVQNAFRHGKLQLVVAEKVSDLEDKIKKSMAKRIRAGEDAAAVVADYLPHKDAGHQKVGQAVKSLVRGLQRGLADLDGRLESVGPAHVVEYLAVLRCAQDVIGRLIATAKVETKTLMEAFADCLPTEDE